MADTGYNWDSSFSYVQKSGTGNWTGLDVADNANAGSALISQDVKSSTEIVFDLYEDNTGGIDGDVTIYILRNYDDTQFEGSAAGAFDATVLGGAYRFAVRPVQNKHLYQGFVLHGNEWSQFRVWILNEAGQTLTTEFKYKQTTIPLAS